VRRIPNDGERIPPPPPPHVPGGGAASADARSLS
jgi:hypothetical protein